MQIEKALINNGLRVSKVSEILAFQLFDFAVIHP